MDVAAKVSRAEEVAGLMSSPGGGRVHPFYATDEPVHRHTHRPTHLSDDFGVRIAGNRTRFRVAD